MRKSSFWKSRGSDTYPPGYSAILAVHTDGLLFPPEDRSLPDQKAPLWENRLLIVGDWPNKYSSDHVKTTCGFRLTDTAEDVVALDFILRDARSPSLVRIKFERKEVTPKELKEMLDKSWRR